MRRDADPDADNQHRGRRERGQSPGRPRLPPSVYVPHRDLVSRKFPRRLRHRPLEQVRQSLFFGAHDATPPVKMSMRPGDFRSRARAFDA